MVTSIAPLHEITSAIMEGVAEPVVIIESHASAHHFAFRPSHMRRLQEADLVIWIDRNFEAGFNRVPHVLPEDVNQLEILPELGVSGGDGHIWYSPELVIRSIEIITDRLLQIDPAHRERYRANALQLSSAVADWRNATAQLLHEYQPRFITDHAFTGRFEADLDYPALATIHDQHDGHSGLGELNEIENLLRQQPAGCLLTLEPAPSPLALELAQKYELQVLKLSPTHDAANGNAGIVERLQIFSSALKTCG